MRYSVEETTLTSLGDAVRAKIAGETRLKHRNQSWRNKTWSGGYVEYPWPSGVEKIVLDNIVINSYEGINKEFKVMYLSSITRFNTDEVLNGTDRTVTLSYSYQNYYTIAWDSGSDATPIELSFIERYYDANGNEVNVEFDELDVNSLTVAQMTEKINEAMVIPEEGLVISGSCKYRFAYNGWNWLIEQAGDKITTDISAVEYMFRESNGITRIPFNLNLNTSMALDYVFHNCNQLVEIPKITFTPGSRIMSTNYLFNGCARLRYLPEDIESWFDWSYIDTATGAYSGGKRGSNILTNCYSLRSVPMGFLAHENPYVSGSSGIYYYLFGGCYVLDEIVGLPQKFYTGQAKTSNLFTNSFSNCYRLKNMTFETNEDGSPIVQKWHTQTIDLSSNIGYASYYGDLLNYNSGITTDKRVSDDATYLALKDDPDWFASDVAYSRYNHDSAVATINSLPDTSAYLATVSGKTNTIKFKGAAGSATDGGAINTLTEEEIAVAAAKGWSVTFV